MRSDRDVLALREGLLDGTVDMVTTDHNPLDIELKKIEFDHAYFGTIGMEAAFSLLQSVFTLKQTIKFLTSGRERFGIQKPTIEVGAEANMTLFNPNGHHTFSEADILSKSKNAYFVGLSGKGEVYGVINNNQLELHT